MNNEKTVDSKKQFIRIASPSKEDVEYVQELMKKGTVPKEDLRENMSFIVPYHGPENED